LHQNGTWFYMPLIRIITRLTEYPTELVKDLRARGFDVETCLAGEQQEAIDLEITLDQCSPKEISETVCDALANKDVVILADADSEAKGRKIRSIAMVLLSSEASAQSAHKTIVPEQLGEIYTSLLRGRRGTRRVFSAYKFKQTAESLRQKIVLRSGQWLKYGQTTGRNLGRISVQAVSEAAVWIGSRKLSWRTRAPFNSSTTEPDLVPSMFNLSSPQIEDTETAEPEQKIIQAGESPENASRVRTVYLWKVLALGSVGVLTIALLLSGFSRAPVKANQSSSENKKILSEQPQTAIPAPVELQRAAKSDVSIASNTLAKSHTGDNDYFQEVVVRHFKRPATNTLPKNGIKRRVVAN